MIKGIAFDLQFTIVYLENFTLGKWFVHFDAGFAKVMDYLTDLGITYDPKRLKRTLRRIRNKYFALTVTRDQQYFTEEILRDTFSKREIKLTAEQFIKCIHIYHSVEIDAWKLFPNAQNTLEQLSKKYKLALITNASQLVTDAILKNQQIDKYFDFVYWKARKPRFPAFQEFKAAMNANFNELAMVGDDIHADIAPAVKLGMKTIHAYRGYEYLPHHAQLNIKPDRKINKFEEILIVIDEL